MVLGRDEHRDQRRQGDGPQVADDDPEHQQQRERPQHGARRVGERGRVGHQVHQAAAPLTAFLISPVAQFVAIPFMTTGSGVELMGGWFGTGPDRGLALVFTATGLLGLAVTLVALRTRHYRQLARRFRGTDLGSPAAA